MAFILNENGAVLEKYKYDAFGQPTVTDGNGANARSWSYYEHCFLFQGREYIREFGIYDYRNRFYLPALGRFVQSDPIGFSAGDMNLFRYVNDDPVSGSDPTGLQEPGPIPDRIWEMAHAADSSNTSHRSPAGIEKDDEGGSKSLSAENEGKKTDTSDKSAKGLLARLKELGDSPELQQAIEVSLPAGRAAGIFKGLGGLIARMFGRNAPSLSPHVMKQLAARGWSEAAIKQAMENGKQIPAINKATGNAATRYIHPSNGQSVVVDNVTNKVIHVGGPGFRYGPASGDAAP